MTYIKKIEITQFGKFSGYELEFERGVNEIILPNESGKSTIADFLLFMLYGFTKTAKKTVALEDNFLKKYLPWSDIGYISGAMVIERDGEQFRIERRHQQSKTTSTALIRDALGREIPAEKEPGELFFGIDCETFMRTFFIRQTDIKFKSTDGIVTALKNLVTTGDEDMSYDFAKAALENERKKYQHIGRRSGRVYDIQKEIVVLETDIRALESETAALSYNMKELERFKAELSRLEAECAFYESKCTEAAAFDAAKKLDALSEIDAEYGALEEKCKNHTFSKDMEADFSTASQVFAERELLVIRKSELESERLEIQQKIASLKDGIEDYSYILEHADEIEKTLSDKGKPNLTLVLSGIITAAVGAALAFVLSPVLWALALIGGVLAVLGLVLKSKPGIDEKVKTSLSLYKTRKGDIDLNTALLEANASRISDIGHDIAVNDGKCDMISKSLGVRNASELSDLQTLYNNIGIIQSRLSDLDKKKREISGGKSIEQLRLEAAAAPCDIGYGTARLSELIADNTNRQAQLRMRIANLSEDEGRAAALEREILEKRETVKSLEQELTNANYRIRVIDLALCALDEAYEKISGMFSPKLTEKAAQPLSLLTDGKYSEVYLDSEFVIRVKADGQLRELGYFSRGTVDAVYFAVRRAAAELIANGNSVPLIMDDPFWSLDDDRLKNAREYTAKLADSMQIILFGARK